LKNNLNSQAKLNFQQLISIVKKLRSSEGCDWDKAQTSDSLVPYFIEEVYELIDSIDNKNWENTKEELGDVMLHLVFQSEIASEENTYTINEVIENICKKLINRHPHVFNHSSLKDSTEIKLNWEYQKHMEKGRASRIDGVPNILPSIIISQRIQEKASLAGFDWEDIDEVWEKLNEEISELKIAQKEKDISKIHEEIGDMLFTVINLSRFFDISAENALRQSNKKFVKRFRLLEKRIDALNKNINDFSPKQLDEIWRKVKKK